jgi:hypothetical protein
MTTFSQLVDEVAAETKRPDLLAEIAVYLNQTIREVHFEPSRGNVAFYANNRREIQLVASSESGHIWDIPNPSAFQAIEAVRYPSHYLGRLEFAKEIAPGPRAVSVPFYYYRSGPSFVFGGAEGYGGVGGLIQISYYEYPRALKYKPMALREAMYDVDDGFTYADAYNGSAELRAQARERVSNWLLERWSDVLREGLRAKIYKRLSDETRQRTSYSLYSQLRQGLYTSEVAEISGVF